MSEEQIKQILKRLEQQDNDLKSYHQEREKLDKERLNAQYKVYKDIREESYALRQEILTLKEEMIPIQSLFNSVVGFDKIAVWIIKFLLSFAALIGAGYTILHFLRKLLMKEL